MGQTVGVVISLFKESRETIGYLNFFGEITFYDDENSLKGYFLNQKNKDEYQIISGKFDEEKIQLSIKKEGAGSFFKFSLEKKEIKIRYDFGVISFEGSWLSGEEEGSAMLSIVSNILTFIAP